MAPTPKLNLSNQQFAERRKAAQRIQRGQPQPGQPPMRGPAAYQQTGAAVTGAGQQAVAQTAAQEAGQQVQATQQQQARQNVATQEQQQMSELQARKKFSEQSRRLQSFAQEIGNDMMDERRQFNRKSKTQAFNNERQLADWTIANAKNENDLQARFQEMQQASETKIRSLEMVTNRLIQAEKQMSQSRMNSKTRAQKVRIAKLRQAMQDKIRREQEKARKRGGMMQVATGVVTMAAGAALTVASGGSFAPVGYAMMAQGAGQTAAGYEQTK